MSRHSSFINFDTNLGSLSLMILNGSLNLGKICCKNSSATPLAVIISLQGIMISIFVQSWSVTVKMESYPANSSSFMIKSINMVWNGNAPVVGVMGLEELFEGVCLLCSVDIERIP